jgi:hypothetical protein
MISSCLTILGPSRGSPVKRRRTEYPLTRSGQTPKAVSALSWRVCIAAYSTLHGVAFMRVPE